MSIFDHVPLAATNPQWIADTYAAQTVRLGACDDSPQCGCGCAIDLRDWWDLIVREEHGELGWDGPLPLGVAA